MPHQSVLVSEILRLLDLKPGAVVLDGTLGSGGHSQAMLEEIGPGGRLIGLDQDPASIKRTQELLGADKRVTLQSINFEHAGLVLEKLNIPAVHAVLIDIGFSSEQIEDPARGFSFDRSGSLGMRMNPENPVSARELVQTLSEDELEKIFREYGEERWARRFAETISRARPARRIETTDDLIEILESALSKNWRRPKGRRPANRRRHFATRVFQALRIAVNDELGVLRRGLVHLWNHVKPGGRLAVISFHSLEDRIVKYQFRDWARSGEGRLINKKPAVAGQEERRTNPRSRSAKLRVIEKSEGGIKA